MEGAAMGSPVSPIVANIYMEEFEQLALNTAPPPPPDCGIKVVCDTFCIIDGQAVEEFLTHLNNQEPTIRFTMELETQGHLPFLDTGLQRRMNGELIISVYRKPTHTDRYLQFHSHHPAQVKRGLVKCLFDKARDVTRGRELNQEMKHLETILQQNGYPAHFI